MDISVEFNDREVLDVLRQIMDRATPKGMRLAMKEIGESLVASTMQRFALSSAPNGSPWPALAEGTVLARLAKITGTYYKRTDKNKEKGLAGKLNARGTRAAAGIKPLIDTGGLRRSISYRIIDGGAGVEIGTNRFSGEWKGGAAVHQFGSRDGRIPARPFIGMSENDKRTVLEILQELLFSAAR